MLPQALQWHVVFFNRSYSVSEQGFQATTRSGTVQAVLLETVNIIFTVLETLPGNGQVRNECFVLMQRMI
jgi:hypothetical protein